MGECSLNGGGRYFTDKQEITMKIMLEIKSHVIMARKPGVHEVKDK